MKIFIAHSLGLTNKAIKYAVALEAEGCETYVPGRDTPQNLPAEEVYKRNVDAIRNADEIHVIWDGASYGTIFDIGAAYALNKPILVVYVKPRTWYSHLRKYEGNLLR